MNIFTMFARHRSGSAGVETRCLAHGRQIIPFQVIRSSRRYKTLSIRIHPDGRVQVAAPVRTSGAEIDALVAGRAGWILRQLQQAQAYSRPRQPLNYLPGEKHLYLGREYPLIINTNKKISNSIKIFRGRLEVYSRRQDPDVIRALLHAWYRERADQVFTNRLQALLPSLPRQPAAPPRLRLRYMKRRWGSCSHQGFITLNTHLVKAPRECVDFVIAHELCHLHELNHGPRFYRLLDQVLPGWPANRVRLDSLTGRLLNNSQAE